jgi:hypothetical protein
MVSTFPCWFLRSPPLGSPPSGLDVVVSGVTLLFFIVVDGRESKTPHSWLAVLGTLTVGVSFGVPLYLALREWRSISRGHGA